MSDRRRLSASSRLLTPWVGMLFFASVVLAQLPFCQCGITCLHLPGGSATSTVVVMTDSPSKCCAGERRDGSPEPLPTKNSPCHDEDAPCSCPIEFVQHEQERWVGPLPVALTAKSYAQNLPAASAAEFRVAYTAGFEDASRWRPTRGSPPLHAPRYVLNSVFLI